MSIDYLLILVGALFYGLITVAGQYFANAGFSLYEIAMLIVTIPILLLPALLLKSSWRISRDMLVFYTIFGLIGAVLQLAQFCGIVRGIPVAVVALLLYSQPIWTTMLGKVLLNEAITRRKVEAAILALAGIVVLIDPWQVGYQPDAPGLGSALLAGMLLSLWVIWGRKSGLRQQHFVTTSFGYGCFSSVWLLLIYPICLVFWPQADYLRLDLLRFFDEWIAVILFGVLAGVLPACLTFAGLRKVDASVTGILMLFEPVSAAVLAYFAFGQALTPHIGVGGILILAANYILIKSSAVETAQKPTSVSESR